MKGGIKMSDEKWSFESSDNEFNAAGTTPTEEHNIVDGTAEVVSETVEKPAGADEAPKENVQAPNMYESYSSAPNTASGSDYAHADSGSATGNGSYQYSSTSHEYYQGENYGSSVGSGSGGNGGGRGKGFLAVVLAIIFGVCIGAGFWGVHRYLGQSNTQATAITDSAENKDATVSGEKKEEAPQAEEQAEDAAKEEAEAEQPQAQANAAAPETDQDKTVPQTEEAQTAPAEETAPAVTEDAGTMIEDAAGIMNEAGLIIADSTTPDTELTKVVDQVMPSIVSVYNDFTEEVQTFYGQTFTREGESTGSGIIIGKTDDELLIVTNNHVVEGADHLRVLFMDQETCDAELKGTDSSNDLAVIAVPLSSIKESTQNQIKVATLGNSDSLKIGEDVIAIGNALGYGQSVTTGIVSANNREISDGTIAGTFIQTDAAINPGNSGGALVNINGHVIGINSSKIGGDTIEGMGFAIPISRAIPIIEELMSRETLSKVDEAERGTIGISGATVTSDVSNAYNLPVGVYVAQILENGGAANSDLHEGDIITAINGQSVSSMEELQKMLQYYKAGTEVTLTVQRQDGNGSYAETSVKVTLGTRESIQQQEQSDEDQSQGRPQQGRPQQEQPQENEDEDDVQDDAQQNGEQVPQQGQGYYNPFEQFGFPFGN